MHTDAAPTGQRGFRRRTSPCRCRHCGPPYPEGSGSGSGPGHLPPGHPPATPSDHPAPRGDVHPHPTWSELEGRDFRLWEPAELSGRRSPQRKPMCAAPGEYARADAFSPSSPWGLIPAPWRYPALRHAGPRHYAPVRTEQCGGCVARDAAAGTRRFDASRVPPPWAQPPVQGKGHTRSRHVNFGPESERCWGCGPGDEYYRWETRAPEQSHFHAADHAPNHALDHAPNHAPKPNGHCGEWADYPRGGEDRDRCLARSRWRGGSEEACNGRRPSQQAFFSTEVPQTDLEHPRRRAPPARDPGQGTVPAAPKGPDPEGQKAGPESVREQIRQVVTDLEGVLGGLKQVHVEMKEVVQQIDRLTANIDLNEEGPDPGVSRDSAPPWGQEGLHVHSHNPPGDPAPQRQHGDMADHVILRTNSPSPVHMASVVKTSRVVPPGPIKDPHRDRRGANGHPPHLCPPRDADRAALSDAAPPPQALDPTVVVGNSTSSSRSQKPPPYPHNGRAERGSKGPAPPASQRTPLYPAGKSRQSSSLV